MGLRPESARWFELLTSREDLTLALETLARTGSVELEAHSGRPARLSLADLQQRMEEYNRLARRYHRYWPEARPRPMSAPGGPVGLLDAALERLRAWEQAAAAGIKRLEGASAEQGDLQLFESMLLNAEEDSLDFALLAGAGPSLAARLFVLPAGSRVARFPGSLLVQHSRSTKQDFLLAVGPPADVDALGVELAAHKSRTVGIPAGLRGRRNEALAQLRTRLQAVKADMARDREHIDTLSRTHGLPDALGDIQRLEWFLTHVTELPVSENFAWITGWTSDLDGQELEQALAAAQVNAVVDFPQAPPGARPPMVMRNPWWARPFELFARLLGTPASDEADPSRLLAVLVPLLFGYMFGDVGHGLVLSLAGILLYRRWPLLRILIPNGLAAMLFGLVFGSVFGHEDIIPALWVHPLEQPLPVLLVPLGGGVLVLLLGLGLNGLESWWRGALTRWAQVEAAVMVLYLSLVVSLLVPRALLVSAGALLWYFSGSLLHARGRFRTTLIGATGSLLESLFQLLVNTVSFVRVGAFALAHGGLSLAFISLAAATGNVVAGFLVMLLGNLIVIMLEGLVVTVQTTRLVLFEFFIRFLRGTGRMFRPLSAPAGDPGLRREM